MRGVIPVGAVVVLVSGCLGRPNYEPTIRYVLEPSVEPPKALSTELSLGIYPLDADQPYRQQRMAYRDAGLRLAHYAHAEWAEPPRDALTETLFEALAGTGRFKDVGYAHDVQMPDLVLLGRIRKFEEVRTVTPWVAECEVRLELRKGRLRELVWGATLTAREPIEHKSPSGLAEAMSRVVAAIVHDAAAQIASVPVSNSGP